MILPVFLLAMLAVFGYIPVYARQVNITQKLLETAEKAAVYRAVGQAHAESGSDGNLYRVYAYAPKIIFPGAGKLWVRAQVHVRPWTGYDGDLGLSEMNYAQKKALRQKIGILFQGSALFDFATVLENVMFPMDFFTDWSRGQKIERARFCLDRVNVVNSDDKYPNELSGGMQKRVGIARAIALNPQFLFCDEPNSGLDPYTSILIDQLISGLTREFNITTVVNTHDINSILEIGDRIAFIHEGNMLWQGDKNSILDTGCEELRDFLSANTLARNVMRR